MTEVVRRDPGAQARTANESAATCDRGPTARLRSVPGSLDVLYRPGQIRAPVSEIEIQVAAVSHFPARKNERDGGGSEKKKPAFRSYFCHCSRARNHEGAARDGLVYSGPKSKPNSGPNGEFVSLRVCELITSTEVSYTFVYA